MDKTLAKKIYKKAEELRAVILPEVWKLRKIAIKTRQEKAELKVLEKELANVDAVEDSVINYVIPKKALSWSAFAKPMYKANASGKHISGVIVYKASNFKKEFRSLEERSYVVSSDNKAFQEGAGGYSLFGSNLAETDKGVRLERIGWAIEYCYFLDKD